jgi:hypothetical protein
MGVLILVGVVIIAGVAIALRSAPSKEMGSLAPGLWCFVGGLVAAVGVAMIGQATFGWVTGFDPPGWLRIVTFWMLPAGVIAAAILGTLSLKQNSGRMLGITGLALAVLSIGVFFAMSVTVDY